MPGRRSTYVFPMTRRERFLLSWPVHTFFELLKLFRLRDRLTCPRCGAVGTWKPHGSVFDRGDERRARRWMCKWCGYYLGPEGHVQVYPDPDIGSWQLPWHTERRETPQMALRASGIPHTWPWRG